MKTPAGAVALIRALAPTHTYDQIAAALNAAGWHSAFGRAFSSLHVGYVCRRAGLGRGVRRAPRPATAHETPPSTPEQVTPLSADKSVTTAAGGARTFPAPFAQ